MFLPALPQGARILIVRLSAIGDVVQSTTVAKNLKRLRPDCHITWLVSPPAAELLEENPCIDRLLVWDRRPFDEASAHGRLLQMLAMLKEGRALLRQYDYDVALDIQCLFLTGLLTRLSGARRCIGIKERHEGNRFFMTTVAPAIDDPHKIRHYMTSLLPLGFDWKDFRPGTSLTLREEERLWARDFLGRQGLSIRKSRPLLLVAIRTTWEDKHPEPEVFAKALAPLGEGVQIVFIGTRGDSPHIEACLRLLPQKARSLAGKLTLRELAALMEEATLLLCCDSGPLYIAEAVGLPTLSLWGPTHPSIYGPLTAGHRFLLTTNACKACCKTKCRLGTNACMKAIEPQRITEALGECLQTAVH